MRHRYIFCGVVWKIPQLKNYRLISSLKHSLGQAIRVTIPDDVELIKYPCDSYSITECERTVHDLGCDCYILFNGKWRKFNWLKNIEPCWWFRVLEYIFGLHNCYGSIGWTDDFKYYEKWFLSSQTNVNERNYPPFKEDKKGLKLKVKLGINDEIINFLRRGTGEDDWLKFFDKFAEQLKETPGKEIWCE